MKRVNGRGPVACALAVSFLWLGIPGAAQDATGEVKSETDAPSRIKRTTGSVVGSVGCQLQDTAGNLWFSSASSGVFRFDGRSFTNFTTRDGLTDDDVSAIIQTKAGVLLFGTSRGICAFDGKTFTKRSELGEAKITCLLEDRAGNLWFGSMAGGVYRHDGKSLTSFLDHGLFNLGANYQFILDILQDRAGNLWFSSWNGGGVWRYDGETFENFIPSADYYEPKDGFVEDGRAFPPPPPGTAYPSTSKNIGDDMVFSMAEERSGRLWFATRRHGACRYDPTTGEFTHFRDKEGFFGRGAYTILEDKRGNIWLTTEDTGVWRYDGQAFTKFTTKEGLVQDSVLSALEDKDGNLWFGTRGFGLSRYDGAKFTTFSE